MWRVHIIDYYIGLKFSTDLSKNKSIPLFSLWCLSTVNLKSLPMRSIMTQDGCDSLESDSLYSLFVSNDLLIAFDSLELRMLDYTYTVFLISQTSTFSFLTINYS